MGYELTQQAYAQATGTTPTNSPWIDVRNPTQFDVNFPIGKFWINTQNQTIWYLNNQSNASGQLLSTWLMISGASGIVESFIVQTGTSPVVPIANQVTFNGATALAGSTPVVTDGTALGTMALVVQLSQAIASTDATKVGLAAFDSAQFSVDPNGFVTLTGGPTPSVLGLIPDAHTSPGTSPVVPNGSGNITLEGGATFATGTRANPIRTNSLAANTIDFQIQLAGSNASVSTPNNFGVAQFDSNSFSVTGGFVTASGTGLGKTITTEDTTILSPVAGNWNIFGTGSIATTGSGNTATIALTGLTNHAVLVGAGSATITKVGPTATTGQVLQNNASADPSYSTATYPSTTTINQILFSSAANTVTGLATGNNGVLITSSSGLPSWLADGTTGQVLTATTGSPPSWQNAASTSITLTADSGSSTGTSFTLSGGTTGLTTSFTGSTLTLVGDLNVAHGGTGNTTFTAYSVICAGTTATGAFQNVSGLGTSGQVLTSNGASALPTWQNSSGGSGITTIQGDSGSITGATVSIKGNATAGSSVVFIGSGTAMTFNVTDAVSNTIIGVNSGNSSITAQQNTGLGASVLTALAGGGGANVAIGYQALGILTSGSSNVAVGDGAGVNLLTGQYNILIGSVASGSHYTSSESSNILLNNQGTVGESNVLRIGSSTGVGGVGALNNAYISGINGNTVSNAAVVTINTSTDQLGTSTIAALSNLTVTTVAHSASPYTVLSTDQFLAVNVSGGVVTIKLPNAPSTGRVFYTKDSTGGAATSNITVTTVGGSVTIDGVTSFVMANNYQSLSIVFDGSNYQVF